MNNIALLVMAAGMGSRYGGLKQLDQVAYVRFASVYRSFQDIAEFRDAIERLESDPVLVKSDT